jgi:Tfp pilus assembly protein PilN
MAVQFNLLPDVKLEFNRQQHTKRIVYTTSMLGVGIVVGLFILSFLVVNILQKKLLDNANNDINNYSAQLKKIPDLDKVLTIQNQLNSLPPMHQKKHVVSRLFDYLPKVTPPNVQIGKLDLDNTANTIIISGTASSVQLVNQFVDTLKFTSYTAGTDQNTKTLAFSGVVLSSVGRSDNKATYTITAKFDPALFDVTKTVTLVVPKETTTQSVQNSPKASDVLFNGQTAPDETQQQGGQ